MSQAVYAPLRSLLNERHWRSATRSARECAEAHSFLFAAIGKTDTKLQFSIFENDNKVFYDKSRKSQILKTIKSRKTIKTVGGNKNG